MSKDDCGSDSDSDSDWNEELINAVRKKQGKSETISEEDRIKRIEECLNEGADVNAVDKHKNTALHLAVKKGYLKVIQFLIKQKARTDVLNKNDQTVVNLAETPGKEDVLKAIKGAVDHGAQRPSTSRDGGSLVNQIFVKDVGQSLKRKNTADNDDDENGKRRQVHSAGWDAEKAEEGEESFREDSEPEDDDIDDEITSGGTSWFDENSEHAASGLKKTLHGNIYQLKLLMLFLRRGLREGYSFRLATEMDAAEKFDDLVFQYEDKTKSETVYRFLQAKHKQDESKTIGVRDLLTENDDDFSLQKYFISYCKMKRHSELSKSSFKDFVLCTNIDFDIEGLKSAKIYLKEVNEPDDFLAVKNSTKKTARYKLVVNEQSELYEILKRTAEAYALARTLVEHAYESKDITLRNDIFKLYHTALAEEVIDVQNKRFSDNFVGGKNLSQRTQNFRKIFSSEALKQKGWSGKNISEDSLWKEIMKNPLKISSRFGERFKLNPDPRVTSLRQVSDELVKLIKNADSNKLVRINKKIYRKNASQGSNERVFAENIEKLAGHVLIIEDEKIKFRSLFFDDNIKPPGNLGDLRNLLKAQLGSVLYNDLARYHFEINNFKTCEEEQLCSKTELPADVVDNKEIAEFFDKLIFAVNQPNEIELGDAITREIAADSQFNLLNADLVGDSFQKEMLDWFKERGSEKGKEGRFFSVEDGRNFFKSVEQKVNTLVSSGLGLTYPEELEAYGIDFEDENEELRDFLFPDSAFGAKPALNLVATGETLPTVIRVHRAIRRTGRFRENDSLIFLHLRTLLLPGIKKRVMNAFKSPNSHHLLVIDCGSVGKQGFQGLYNRLCDTMRKNICKKLILITRGNKVLTNRLKIRLENCSETQDYVSFNDLTIESRHKLLKKLVINFQGKRGGTSFGKLLGICSRDNFETREMINFEDFIDTEILVKLIRCEEIRVGTSLKELGETENYYITRTFKRQVVIKDDILRSKSTSDLFAISFTIKEDLTRLTSGGNIRSFDEIEPGEQRTNEFIILDTGREAEQFETLCENSSVNVHWLHREWGKFIWNKSRGDIAVLAAHRDADESRRSYDYEIYKTIGSFTHDQISRSSFTTDQLVDCDEGEKVVIISDSAGMGKSTVFTHLAKKIKEKKSDLWVIRIDLNDFTDEFRAELMSQSFNERDRNGAIKFFVDKLSNLKTDLERKILKIMINNRSGVALLFDGIDEISPGYENTVINLLQVLNEIGVAKLFVATRPHMRGTLENKFGIFSHTMEPFSEDNRIDFFIRFWKKGLGLGLDVEERIEMRLKTYAKAVNEKIVKSIDDWVEEFAGIPLQARMIAENFQDDKQGEMKKGGVQVCEEFLRSDNYEPELPRKIKIVDLYKYFVDKKYYIYCTEKKRDIVSNLAVITDGKNLREIFFKLHQKLALYTLFSSEGFLNFLGPPVLPMLLDSREIENINEYFSEIIKGEERTGIVTQVVNGKPQFIHRTFAEYFAAMFLINILKQADHDHTLREFIVKQILLGSRYKIIRAFLNGLLPEETSLSDRLHAIIPSAKKSWELVLHARDNIMFDETVFHKAAREGNYGIVKFLLNRFEKHDETRKYLISFKDASGETISHIAANQQHWDQFIWLVENEGAEVNSTTDNGRTPLHAAASRGNLRMVQWLVKNGADANALTNDGKTPMYEAAHSGNLTVLQWLIGETGANVNSRNRYGKTLLHEAASTGRLDVVEWLVNIKNADVTARINDGKTVIHEAADKGQWDVVKWLILNSKVDVNCKGNGDGTILHTAAISGDLELVKWLVDKGADIDAKSVDGCTILHVTACDRRWTVFKWLVEKGANVNVKSWIGDTVMHQIASQQKWDMVKWLVGEKGADVNIKTMYDGTVMHKAARSKRWELVEWLLENTNADVNAVAHDDGTVLCHAASQERWDTVKWLVEEKNADVNAGLLDGKSVLHFVALNNKWDLVNWLVVDKGADVNIRAKDGKTLMHHAASFGQFDQMKFLAKGKDTDISLKTDDGMTVLHCAASSGAIPIVKWLAEEKGLDIEEKSYRGETPLHVAASKTQWDMVRWLVEKQGASVQSEDNDGFTVLHIIANFRQWDLIRLFANSNDVNVNVETRGCRTVLRYAVEAGEFDTIKWLIESKGINVNAKFRNNKTILHYAVASGNLRIVEWLVDHKGADIKTEDGSGRTLLHESAAAGKCEIFKWLIDKGTANIDAVNNDGWKVLHEAAAAANFAMIRLLVEFYKVDVITTNDRGDTALDLYCSKYVRRDEAIVKLLQKDHCNLQSALRRRKSFKPWQRTRPGNHSREGRVVKIQRFGSSRGRFLTGPRR